jgi:hypothetical protein
VCACVWASFDKYRHTGLSAWQLRGVTHAHRESGSDRGLPTLIGRPCAQVMPTNHQHRVCSFHRASAPLVQEAIAGALKAQRQWEGVSLSVCGGSAQHRERERQAHKDRPTHVAVHDLGGAG